MTKMSLKTENSKDKQEERQLEKMSQRNEQEFK